MDDGTYSNSRGQSVDYNADNGYSRSQPQRRGFRGTEENAKTKLCMRWLAGDCRFGPRCNFAHGSHELRKIPPKPGRFSHDTRERELEKERQLSGYLPYGGYHSVSFDAAYRSSAPHSSFYADNYLGTTPSSSSFNRAPGSYPSPVMGPPSMNGNRYSGGPGLVQQSGPIHISAPSAHGAGSGGGDYYNPDPELPQDGPNGWTMYRDVESGKPYYHNHTSGITQWKCPDEWPMH
eukprot:g8594.t1